MPSSAEISSRAKELQQKFRMNEFVVGIWSNIEATPEGTVWYITMQNEDQEALQIVLTPDGREEIRRGEIKFTRRESGHPSRIASFVSKNGETTYLQEGEF